MAKSVKKSAARKSTVRKAAKGKTARKAATKKAATKKSASERSEMTHIIEPAPGSVRAKLLAIYKKAGNDLAKAREVAIKSGVNKFTANKQLYLIDKVGGKRWSKAA